MLSEQNNMRSLSNIKCHKLYLPQLIFVYLWKMYLEMIINTWFMFILWLRLLLFPTFTTRGPMFQLLDRSFEYLMTNNFILPSCGVKTITDQRFPLPSSISHTNNMLLCIFYFLFNFKLKPISYSYVFSSVTLPSLNTKVNYRLIIRLTS